MSASSYVSQVFIESMNARQIPWHKTWKPGFSGACSWLSGKPYSFLNQCMLRHRDEYIGVQRAIDEGADFRGVRTERAVWCSVYDKKTGEKDPETGEDKVVRKFGYRQHSLLPVSLLRLKDGSPFPHHGVPDTPDAAANRLNEGLETILFDYISQFGVTVRNGAGVEPHYDPESNFISIPSVARFTSQEAYYAELFRLLVASTATPLERDFGATTRGRAREELVREMGSAMLTSAFGIDTKDVFDNSVAYCEKWIKVFRDDEDAIIRAASAAEKAVNLILGLRNIDINDIVS